MITYTEGSKTMKRIEISYNSNLKELEKLNARLERANKALAKKQAAAEKAGVADWDGEQYRAWIATVATQNGWIVNTADVKKNGAWFDLYGAKREVEDINRQIENASERFEKKAAEVEEYRASIARMEDLKAKEELQKLEFEQEQREWAKDGITLESRYHGKTPSGKGFSIVRNSGATYRSLHCFTLYLEGSGMVFTSGEFWRAYGIVKNN